MTALGETASGDQGKAGAETSQEGRPVTSLVTVALGLLAVFLIVIGGTVLSGRYLAPRLADWFRPEFQVINVDQALAEYAALRSGDEPTAIANDFTRALSLFYDDKRRAGVAMIHVDGRVLAGARDVTGEFYVRLPN